VSCRSGFGRECFDCLVGLEFAAEAAPTVHFSPTVDGQFLEVEGQAYVCGAFQAWAYSGRASGGDVDLIEEVIYLQVGGQRVGETPSCQHIPDYMGWHGLCRYEFALAGKESPSMPALARS